MTELIINFATRGRPQQFLKSIQNITSTIDTQDYRILVSCDTDDKTMNHLAMINELKKYPKVEIYYNEPTSKVGAINATIPHFGDFYWLINHSDDMLYNIQNWDVHMLYHIKEIWGENNTDFFAHFNDSFIDGRLPTLNICGYDYFRRDGDVYASCYNSICCDAENWHKAMMRGRHHYFPYSYYDHIHPANLPNIPVDQTYRRNDKFGKQDEATYFERMSYGFYVENPVFMPEEVAYYMNKRIQDEPERR